MNLAEFRKQYPQYDDMPDADLVRGLHGKFYPDLPFDAFAEKIGHTAELTEAPRDRTPKPPEPTAIDALMHKLVTSGRLFELPSVPTLTAGPEAQQFPADDMGVGAQAVPELRPEARVLADLLPAHKPPLVPDTLAKAHPIATPKKSPFSILDYAQAAPVPGFQMTPSPEAATGAVEALLALKTIGPALAAGGLAGVGAAATGKGLREISEAAQGAIGGVQYEPKSDLGKQAVDMAFAPFHSLNEWGTRKAREIYENGIPITDPETGNVADVGKGNAWLSALLGSSGELGLAAIPFLNRLRGTKNFSREVSPKDITAEIAEGMTEGARLREVLKTQGRDAFNKARDEAISRRMSADPAGQVEPVKPPTRPAAPPPEVAPGPPQPPVAAPEAPFMPPVVPRQAPPTAPPLGVRMTEPPPAAETPRALPEPEAAPPTSDPIKAAYDALKSERGMENIEIADIRDKAGVSQQEVEAYLRRQSKAGNAVMTMGEPSLADERELSGGVKVFDDKPPFLLSRIDAPEIEKPTKIKRAEQEWGKNRIKNTWRGEVYDANNDFLGSVHLDGGKAYILNVEDGIVKKIIGEYKPSDFEKSGRLRLSANQEVQKWKLKTSPEAAQVQQPETGTEKASTWAAPGTKKIIDGVEVWQGRLGLGKGKWSYGRNYHDTPEAAAKEYHDDQADQKRIAAEEEKWNAAAERVKASDYTDQDIKTLTGMGLLASTGRAEGILRGLGLRATDARKVVRSSREVDMTSGGATLYGMQDVIERARRKGFLPAKPQAAQPKPEAPKAPPSPAKEPWQMTRKEWQDEWGKNRAETFDTKNRKSGAAASIARIERGKFLNYGVDGEMTSMGRERPDHKQVVKKAISEGKPVPAEVLKDYPDLMPKKTAPKIASFPKGGWFIDADDNPVFFEGPTTTEQVSGYRGPYSEKEAKALVGYEAVNAAKPKSTPAKLMKQTAAKKAAKTTTLRGRIQAMGGLRVGNFKGEFKEASTGVKFLLKKSGEPLDLAEQTLKDEGWLGPDENLIDVLRDAANLRRNKVAGEMDEKREQDKTAQEKQFEKEMNREPEAPPEGDYIVMNAEDLPEGKKLTLIEDRSQDGWDVYEVVEKDPFEIILQDGIKITLKPFDKVEVRREDLTKGEVKEAKEREPGADEEAPAATEKPALNLQGERAMPKPMAEMRTKGKKQGTAQQGGLEFGAPETPDTLELKGEKVGPKEALRARKVMEEEFGGTSGRASVGEFATEFAGEGPRGQSFRDVDSPLIDMPELVELATDLMKGRIPQVKEALRIMQGRALGVFYGEGSGKIQLKAEIFKDIKQALATLAHEIGHLVDYLPQRTLSRGNILGRIASLHKYMKHTLPKSPGAPGELTAEDRKRIKAEARKLLSSPREIDEEITRVINITTEDILAIWNNATAGMKNEELYRYIATLGTAEKKSIIKEALKGQVPRELARFAQIITEKTGRKITVKRPASDAELEARFNEMIREELRKRELLSRDEIMDELKLLSRTWKPFDPQANRKFTKYRYSGVELYADAFSAMMNAPQLVQRLAPKFHDAWFAYLENKPEVRDLYNGILDLYRSGDTESHRVSRLRDGFRKGDAAYGIETERSYKDSLARELIDANHFLIKKVKEIGERNVPAGKNPVYRMEDLAYSGSEAEWYVSHVYRGAVRKLEKVGLTWEDLGELMFHQRVSAPTDEFGGRAEKANPLGWHSKISKDRIASLRSKLTPEQNKALDEARDQLQQVHQYAIDKAEKIYGKELADKMRSAVNYATFNVVSYIEKKYGRGPGAKLYRQIGTLAEVANPATATVMKDLSVIHSVNRQMASKSVVSFLRENFPREVQRASRGMGGMILDPKDQKQGMLTYLEDGKLQAWYVPKEIAEIFEENPIQAWAVSKFLRATVQPFRTLFTEINYGFWAFNLFRDTKRAMNNLPGAWTGNFMPIWMKSLKPAFRSVFGIHDTVAEEMQKGNMLISIGDTRGMRSDDQQIERLLKRYHMRPLDWKANVLSPFGRMFTFFTNIGRALERSTKIAGYQYYRQKFPDMSREEIAHLVRNTGSPDFLRLGRAYPIYNNLLMFSNAMKEGYRGDYEALKGRPVEWTIKKIYRLVLPKLLLFGAAIGLMGDDNKRIIAGASEYDKSNYHIIPLGLTGTGKSVYIRVPVDETSRFLGGVMWKLLNHQKPELLASLFDYTAGQAPTINPAIDVLADTIAYASGMNPYDNFRGRYAIQEDIFKAGGERSRLQFAKYLAQKMGAGVVYKFKHDDVDSIKTELEQVLGYPIVSNIIGRFVKVSDYGLKEQLREERSVIASRRAGENLDVKDAINKMIRGEKLSEEDTKAFSTIITRDIMDKLIEGKPIGNAGVTALEKMMERNLLVAMRRKYGNAFLQEYMTAQNAEERKAVLTRILKINGQYKEE